jgi:hypothetical protein
MEKFGVAFVATLIALTINSYVGLVYKRAA